MLELSEGGYNFLIIIEDKADLSKHIKLNDDGIISKETKDIVDYAVNGALFYAKHLIENTNYKKIIAFGISGNEKRHRITPIFIDVTLEYKILDDVESFINFSEKNIKDYYIHEILKENTDDEKNIQEILKDARELHEDLRNYGNLKDIDKPLVVSGILLALDEVQNGNFSINNLTGDEIETNGQKIYKAIESNLKRVRVYDVKKDKILSQFSIIKDTTKLNEINKTLGKTPLKHFTEFLNEHIFKSIKYTKTAEDYIGRFYGEFMSYSGGDGQTLGIVLTPKHIAELFCDLVDLKVDDVVFDPCCGTGGFLIAAMHNMFKKTNKQSVINNIKEKQLHGIELQTYMFTIATTNMILRGDGKSNIRNEDFLLQNPKKLQEEKGATVGFMNPPYSQGSKKDPNLYEIAFIEHLLNSLTKGARCVVIVPQSSMTGKSKDEQIIKTNILKNHTLEGVITLNKDTFYGIGVMPCIAIFTAGKPHQKDKICKFINFEDDGFKVKKHSGLVETELSKDKKQHLLDVWFDRVEDTTKFCVKTTIEDTDEWLHSFYYFNDELPVDEDFDKTISDYLSFEFSMIMQDREYLFKEDDYNEDENKESGDIEDVKKKIKNLESMGDGEYKKLSDREWKEFKIGELFNVCLSKGDNQANLLNDGKIPLVSAGAVNNGICKYIKNGDGISNIFDSKKITVDMFGKVFYHQYNFFAVSHGRVNILSSSIIKNNYIGLFFCNVLEKRFFGKYSFANMCNKKRLERETILLPTTPQGEPDYQFMEDYIKELIINKKRQKYIEYVKKKIKNLESMGEEEYKKLSDREWKEFKIEELFFINSGINISEINRKIGDIPYVSSTSMNNGISCFIDNKNNSFDKNVISVNSNGSVGYCFYHKYNSLFSNDCKKLKIKKEIYCNEYVYLFLSNQIMEQKNKYSYGYKMGSERLKKQIILLPTTPQGEPDYQFMEDYIKKLILKKYNNYLNCLSKIINN